MRTTLASVRTSWPKTRAWPLSAPSTVVRIRMTVVLPAPFGPRRPKMVPASTPKLTPSRARTVPPKVLCRSSSWMARLIRISFLPGGRAVWWRLPKRLYCLDNKYLNG